MKLHIIIKKNLKFYHKHYRLVAMAVVITVAVIVGSFSVGDSVKTTLINRVNEKLGNTETVIFSRNSFMNEEILQNENLKNCANGYILTNGFISANGKLIPVFIWGTDDTTIVNGFAKINESLFKEIGDKSLSDIVLRLPATGLVPSGSLFVTKNYTTSLRLVFNGIIESKQGGNLSLKSEHGLPLNIFVSREELAKALEIEGKINLILSSKIITNDDFNEIWNYKYSGLEIIKKEDFTEINSDRIFIQNDVTYNILTNNENTNRLFSYLANSIENEQNAVPYSFVTAMDYYKNIPLQKQDIILSDYTAKRLNAKIGDSIQIEYYASKDLKTLETKSKKFIVKEIVPLAEFQEDSTLSANFPGLSNVERCTDWDSDVPINMDKITDEDEYYWKKYRNTPKAIICYDAISEDWANAFGNATSIRILTRGHAPLLQQLTPEMFGIQIIQPREAALFAAKNSIDFFSLFIALGFFIIISAVLLLIIPFSEMLFQRKNEIQTLHDLGFSKRRISNLFLKEAAPIVCASSLVGVLVGILYTALIMWLLGSVWKGATHTDGFGVYLNFTNILIGFLSGILISFLFIWITINLNAKKRKGIRKKAQRKLCETLRISLRNFAVKNFKSTNQLIIKSLNHNRKQHILSFFALMLGVFIVFVVGLNRKGFADSEQIRTGTGGYSLWCETSVPIFHNLSTLEGRQKLSLTDLPKDAEIVQCLRYSADEASCLNLNKVIKPSVLGIDFEIFQSFTPTLKGAIEKELVAKKSPLGDLGVKGELGVIPALVDATVLTWSLGMKLGDTLYYEGSNNQKIAIRLVGTLPNTIFQGHILIDKKHFQEIWTEISGSEVALIKVKENEISTTKNLLETALNEYGIRVTTTNERLKQFNSVTDTYLTIFLTLGGLGLLLGIFSFVIVIRKNLLMRQKEISLLQTFGFTDQKIKKLLFKENIIVPLSAIATGVLFAFLFASFGISNIGFWIWVLALFFAVLFVVCVLFFVKKLVGNVVGKV